VQFRPQANIEPPGVWFLGLDATLAADVEIDLDGRRKLSFELGDRLPIKSHRPGKIDYATVELIDLGVVLDLGNVVTVPHYRCHICSSKG
jgi:hypothetical protein